MRIGSLFSGIGGLELGLEWAGLGRTVWQVEKDEFCRSVLERHWPIVERFEDVREVGAVNLGPVDLVCGGFPCTDISSAGKGAGLAGDSSGLWTEFARIVDELKPEWAVVENSGSRVDRWVDDICDQLEDRGYKTLPVPLSAQAAGAPHRRNRVFVVANSRSNGYAGKSPPRLHDQREPWNHANRRGRFPPRRGDSEGWREFTGDGGCQPGIFRGPNGLLSGVDRLRLRALGNAVVPQCAEVIGWMIRELAA